MWLCSLVDQAVFAIFVPSSHSFPNRLCLLKTLTKPASNPFPYGVESFLSSLIFLFRPVEGGRSEVFLSYPYTVIFSFNSSTQPSFVSLALEMESFRAVLLFVFSNFLSGSQRKSISGSTHRHSAPPSPAHSVITFWRWRVYWHLYYLLFYPAFSCSP